MRTIIAIVGKTCSGKDTLARYLEKHYKIPTVVSYTTRPMRNGETDGVEHWFISKEEMDQIVERGNVIAYTKNEQTGIEYCASIDNLDGSDGNIQTYIINPEGIRWFREHYKGNDLKLYTVYLQCSEFDLLKRAANRGDDMAIFQKRLESERDEFDLFNYRGLYDAKYYTRDISVQSIAEDIMKNVLYQQYMDSLEEKG